MNKKLSLPLLLTALAICWTVLPARAVSINFDILDSYIETGESFDVNVYAEEVQDAGDLVAFGFDVVDSASLFAYDDYTVGTDFIDVGYNNDNLLPANYVAGVTNLVWPDSNAGNNNLLATLSFTAGSTAGTNTLSITGLPDGFHGLYYENWQYDADCSGLTEITIHDAAPVPEPATMLLFGTGLAGLVGSSLRKKR